MAKIDKDILETADEVAGRVMYALYNGEGPARPIMLALVAERQRKAEKPTTWGWDAKSAISRAPNDYEHIGLSAPDALARIRALVDTAEERRGAGCLVSHIEELATCLPCWPSATQVAEAA